MKSGPPGNTAGPAPGQIPTGGASPPQGFIVVADPPPRHALVLARVVAICDSPRERIAAKTRTITNDAAMSASAAHAPVCRESWFALRKFMRGI